MNPLLSILTHCKSARYGLLLASGVLIGSWIGNQYPEQTAAFWGQPIMGLALSLAAVWGGAGATKEWKAKVEEALNAPPPGKTICGCEHDEPASL